MNKKGQSLVELAITLPIILIILFAMISIGFYIFDMSVFTFASNKALDQGIGIVISRDLTQNDIDNIKADAINYTDVSIFASAPTVHVDPTINGSTGEKSLTVSIESTYNCGIPFIESIFGSNPKISAKNACIYKR